MSCPLEHGHDEHVYSSGINGLSTLKAVKKSVLAALASISFFVQERATQKAAASNQKQYQMVKVSSVLKKGGFPEPFAKFLATACRLRRAKKHRDQLCCIRFNLQGEATFKTPACVKAEKKQF